MAKITVTGKQLIERLPNQRFSIADAAGEPWDYMVKGHQGVVKELFVDHDGIYSIDIAAIKEVVMDGNNISFSYDGDNYSFDIHIEIPFMFT